MLSKNQKLSLFINIFSWFKIPLLAYVRPKIITLNNEESVVRVKLNSRSRNHLNVMYFGALAMGAELSVALMAVNKINESKKRIDFLFKDFDSKFLKRADKHVFFCCPEAEKVNDLIRRSLETPDRLEGTYTGFAYVDESSREPVMEYKLTLSVKNRSIK